MTSSTNTIQNFIEGLERPASSGQVFVHESPRTGSKPVTVPESDLMDVVQAVQAMNRATSGWGKATREEREEHVRKTLVAFHRRLQDQRSEIATMLAIDIGLPVRNSLSRSLPAAIACVQATLEAFEINRLRYPSSGNAAVFLGWTDPLLSFCRRIPAILASGTAVAVKPSSRAPRTVAHLARLWVESLREASAPVGLFAVLHGRGKRTNGEDEGVGQALLQHPGLKVVYWIGSSEAALEARLVADQHDKRFHFVGSGRNPAILFQGHDEAAFDRIVEDLSAAIVDPHSTGPYRPSRIFVQESIYKPTLEALAAKLESFKLGDPLDLETVVGPLPAREVAQFQTQVQHALSETGHLVTGGTVEGSFARPTLVRDLTNCSTLQSEELAGPWATIASFKYAHEALKYANTSPLGLAGYVLHPDSQKAPTTAEKLEASRIFFSSRPPWPDAFLQAAAATKKSANAADGVAEIIGYGFWRATWFS